MTTTALPIFTVDAFTDIPYAGNPAAVCLVPDGLSLMEKQMLLIAKGNVGLHAVFIQLIVLSRRNASF